MDEHKSRPQEASDPVTDKLVRLNERLDELLLELGDLKGSMPSEDDVENLGKPHKNVRLKPTEAEIKQKQMQMAEWASEDEDHQSNC